MPKKPNVGWMAQLAQGKRSKMLSDVEHVATVYARTLHKLVDFHKPTGSDGLYLKEPYMEIFFGELKNEVMSKLGWTEEQAFHVQKEIIHKVYGDPNIMSSNSLRQHSVPYWNPTAKVINIHPLGLVKKLDEKTREAIFHEFLGPGEHIMLPEGYTKGGKHSTVYGVAPQLRPLPRQVDSLVGLDLEPITYTEWCTYMESSLSPCCRKQVMWYDGGDRLACSKCGKNVKGN